MTTEKKLISEVRYYKGKHPCQTTPYISLMKTIRVQWLDNSFRDKHSYDIVPVRMCWRKIWLGRR